MLRVLLLHRLLFFLLANDIWELKKSIESLVDVISRPKSFCNLFLDFLPHADPTNRVWRFLEAFYEGFFFYYHSLVLDFVGGGWPWGPPIETGGFLFYRFEHVVAVRVVPAVRFLCVKASTPLLLRWEQRVWALGLLYRRKYNSRSFKILIERHDGPGVVDALHDQRAMSLRLAQQVCLPLYMGGARLGVWLVLPSLKVLGNVLSSGVDGRAVTFEPEEFQVFSLLWRYVFCLELRLGQALLGLKVGSSHWISTS